MTETTFFGLDLAWGERNPSGLAVAHWDAVSHSIHISDTAHLHSDCEIRDWIRSRVTVCALIGIDAPIIARNDPGTMRNADRLVQQNFARYHAGVYPANRIRCARPVRICKMFRRMGFSANPIFDARSSVRRQLEVYPHAAQVTFLKRNRIIKYKKGILDSRRYGLKQFAEALVVALHSMNPPLKPSTALDRLIALDPVKLNGRALKALEDQLDAILCAYMACYYWFWTVERCTVFGDSVNGYIICPRVSECAGERVRE